MAHVLEEAFGRRGRQTGTSVEADRSGKLRHDKIRNALFAKNAREACVR